MVNDVPPVRLIVWLPSIILKPDRLYKLRARLELLTLRDTAG